MITRAYPYWFGDHQQIIQCALIHRCCVLIYVWCALFSVGNKVTSITSRWLNWTTVEVRMSMDFSFSLHSPMTCKYLYVVRQGLCNEVVTNGRHAHSRLTAQKSPGQVWVTYVGIMLTHWSLEYFKRKSSFEIALLWMSLCLTNDDKSKLVQVSVWCRQAPNHYLSQCWPKSLTVRVCQNRTMSQKGYEIIVDFFLISFRYDFVGDAHNWTVATCGKLWPDLYHLLSS